MHVQTANNSSPVAMTAHIMDTQLGIAELVERQTKLFRQLPDRIAPVLAHLSG